MLGPLKSIIEHSSNFIPYFFRKYDTGYCLRDTRRMHPLPRIEAHMSLVVASPCLFGQSS